MSRDTEISTGQPIESLPRAGQSQESQALAAMRNDVQVTTRGGLDSHAQAGGDAAKCVTLPGLDFDDSQRDLDKPIYSQRDMEAMMAKLKLSMLHKKPGEADGYGDDNFGINGFRNKPLWKPEFDNPNYDPRFNSYRKPQFQDLQQEGQTHRPYHNPVPGMGRSYLRNETNESRVPTLGGNIEPRRSRQGGTGTADEWDSEATLRRTRQLMGLDKRTV